MLSTVDRSSSVSFLQINQYSYVCILNHSLNLNVQILEYCFNCRNDTEDDLSTVNDIVGAVRSKMTKRPKRKVTKRV